MDSISPSSGKVKVTTSLDADLVKAIDEFLKASKARSRSQLIEDVLRKWHREQKKREIESQVEEYYLSLSDKERKEDRQWTKTAAPSAHRLWEE
jgi:metal-responsive CopG/Arc/MetJ family transcriptional regulator